MEAFHEQTHSSSSSFSTCHPASAFSSTSTTTRTRTNPFMVLMHARKRKEAFHEACSSGRESAHTSWEKFEPTHVGCYRRDPVHGPNACAKANGGSGLLTPPLGWGEVSGSFAPRPIAGYSLLAGTHRVAYTRCRLRLSGVARTYPDSWKCDCQSCVLGKYHTL